MLLDLTSSFFILTASLKHPEKTENIYVCVCVCDHKVSLISVRPQLYFKSSFYLLPISPSFNISLLHAHCPSFLHHPSGPLSLPFGLSPFSIFYSPFSPTLPLIFSSSSITLCFFIQKMKKRKTVCLLDVSLSPASPNLSLLSYWLAGLSAVLVLAGSSRWGIAVPLNQCPAVGEACARHSAAAAAAAISVGSSPRRWAWGWCDLQTAGTSGRDTRAREHKLHFFLANHVLPQNVCRPCVALHLSSAGENVQTLTKELWVWRAGITLWRSRRSSDNTCTHKMRPQSLQMHESALKNMHFSNKKDTGEQNQGHLTAAMKCFYIYSSAHLIETRREKMSGSLLIHAGTLTQWCTKRQCCQYL